MEADDFELQPRGPYLFDTWLSRRPVSARIGEFAVELREAPDARLIERVNALALLVQEKVEDIHDLIYVHYRRLQKYPDWLRECGVPTGLSRAGVLPYVRGRYIVVERDYEDLVFIDPLWDVEHKIYVRVRDGAFVLSDH